MKPPKRTTCMSLVTIVGIAAAVAGCGGSGGTQSPSASAAPAGAAKVAATKPVSASRPASTSASVGEKAITLRIKSDEEHGKKGPEGKWHDAFLPASFSVAAGQRVKVTVYNYDEGSHSFNAPELGVGQIIPAGSAKAPHKVTFAFTAPSKAGKYQWFCAMPCDPWAMTHTGFMKGYVTVTA